MSAVTATAYARIGLLGNPSDGYGGRVLALAYPEHAATISVGGPRPGRPLPLIDAAVRAFHRDTGLAVPPLAPRWHTSIPRQVGLSGSSALIAATLRALSRWAGGHLEGLALAQATWHVETRDLGIAAGPQDRVIQALQGLVEMDFGPTPWLLSPLDPAAVPPLLLGWPARTGAPSGVAHGALARRWQAGDPAVQAALADCAALAAEGAARLRRGELDLRDLVDENLVLRQRLMTVDPADLAAAAAARALGAGAKLAGSGGALVATAPDPTALSQVEGAWRELGLETLRPTVSRAAGP